LNILGLDKVGVEQLRHGVELLGRKIGSFNGLVKRFACVSILSYQKVMVELPAGLHEVDDHIGR
jgi:hypothetical protein